MCITPLKGKEGDICVIKDYLFKSLVQRYKFKGYTIKKKYLDIFKT